MHHLLVITNVQTVKQILMTFCLGRDSEVVIERRIDFANCAVYSSCYFAVNCRFFGVQFRFFCWLRY